MPQQSPRENRRITKLRFVPIGKPRHLGITKGSEQAVMSAQIEWFRLRILTAIIIAASILTCLGEEQIPKLNYAIVGG